MLLWCAAQADIVFFTEGPCDNPSVLTVDSIEALALRCEAFGIPAPSVSLSLEETELVSWHGQGEGGA